MQRSLTLDYTKLILAIFVITLHTNLFEEIAIINFITVQGIFRVAVPLFFLINGFFFDESKFKTWIFKSLKLYLVWSIIYIPFYEKFTILELIKNFLFGFKHLWYIQAMILSGLFIFKLRRFIVSQNYVFTAAIIYSIGFLIQTLGNLHILENLDYYFNNIYVYRNVIFYGIPFMSIGYFMRHNSWLNKIDFNKIVLVVLFALLMLESYLNYIVTKEAVDLLLTTLVFCPFLFRMLLSINIHYHLPRFLLKQSTGIYLIHPAVLFISRNCFELNSIFMTFWVLSVSIIIVAFLEALPPWLKIL